MAKKVVPLRAYEHEHEKWKEAAGAQGETFSAWAVRALNEQAALEQALSRKEPGRSSDSLPPKVEPDPVVREAPKQKCPRAVYHQKGTYCKSCERIV